jgi:hypothetical protein
MNRFAYPVVTLVLFSALTTRAVAQVKAVPEKPCIAFANDSETPDGPAELARRPLEIAVTLSGDFTFVPLFKVGCWTIHVLALEVRNGSGRIGYVVSYTVTDRGDVIAGDGLMFGPDTSIFDTTMRQAAAEAVKSIRQHTPDTTQ